VFVVAYKLGIYDEKTKQPFISFVVDSVFDNPESAENRAREIYDCHLESVIQKVPFHCEYR